MSGHPCIRMSLYSPDFFGRIVLSPQHASTVAAPQNPQRPELGESEPMRDPSSFLRDFGNRYPLVTPLHPSTLPRCVLVDIAVVFGELKVGSRRSSIGFSIPVMACLIRNRFGIRGTWRGGVRVVKRHALTLFQFWVGIGGSWRGAVVMSRYWWRGGQGDVVVTSRD